MNNDNVGQVVDERIIWVAAAFSYDICQTFVGNLS